MSRILLAWELGMNTGHLHKLGCLISPLLEQGHKVTIVAKDVTSAQRVLGSYGIDILQAPHRLSRIKGLRPAANYNEVLFHVGYLGTAEIEAHARAWYCTFKLAKADLVIAEHAPTALLAARAANIPTLAIGTGFSVPPNTVPLPALVQLNKNDKARQKGAEQRALKTINKVLTSLKADSIKNTAELFYEHTPILLTISELDHYGTRENCKYWGAHTGNKKSYPTPIWPSAKGEKVFIYMGPSLRQFGNLVKQMGGLDYNTLVVAPGISKAWADKLSNKQIKVSPNPVDIKSVASQCRVNINHAAHGTLAHLLSFGRPAIMLPHFVEQSVIAQRIEDQGLGLKAPSIPSKRKYKLIIEKFLDTPSYFNAAEEIAEKYRNNPIIFDDFIDYFRQQINTILGATS